MTHCRIENNICVDKQSGSMGVCRSCEYSTHTPPIAVRLAKRDYALLMDLCGEGMTMEKAVTELVNQGIRSIRRHTGREGEDVQPYPTDFE